MPTLGLEKVMGWVFVFLGEETRDKEGWTLSCFHDKKGVGMNESR